MNSDSCATANAVSYRKRNVLAAWMVHAFTMTGVLWASLAILSLVRGDIKMMWLWLGIAMVVDGIDGTFARKAQVKKVIPWFNGSTLDVIVDYLTWTFIPAVFMYQVLDFGTWWMGFIVMVLVNISSMFCYCNENEKSVDNYFVGFPAAWNIAALCLWLFALPWWMNLILTAILMIMTLVPTAYMHPFRTKRLMVFNIIATVFWVASAVALVITHPSFYLWQWIIFWTTSIWFIVVSAWRSMHGVDSYGMEEKPVDTSALRKGI